MEAGGGGRPLAQVPAASLFHPLSLGGLELEGNLFLAPMAGYTDAAFRSLCVEYGACLTFTELVSSEALVRGVNREQRTARAEDAGRARVPSSPTLPAGESAQLLQRAPNETRLAIQLFGSEPEVMYRAALLLAPWKPDAVDINAGCPVPKVTKTGAGAALMKAPSRLAQVTAAVTRASREALGGVPVSVKMRSGYDAGSLNYLDCALAAIEAGASMITLHPRTRAQGYAGQSDWTHIARLVTALSDSTRARCLVCGSGDLAAPEDARRMLNDTGCDALMFARGAEGNPFIFAQTKALLQSGAYQPVPPAERITAAFRQFDLLAARKGENRAALEMRKTFCAYIKGLRAAAQLRAALVHAKSRVDYEALLRGLS